MIYNQKNEQLKKASLNKKTVASLAQSLALIKLLNDKGKIHYHCTLEREDFPFVKVR